MPQRSSWRTWAQLLRTVLTESSRGNRELPRLVWRDFRGRVAQAPENLETHLDAAIAWICRAHDAAGGGGVARSYAIARHPLSGTTGWAPAYPETTGYIIPTVFDVAAQKNDTDLRRRAIAMADWEVDVQMPSGAVQGGAIGYPPTPSVFNTGQVIFGWIRAARETGDERYVRAACEAGRFLVEHQDPDGVWRRGLSQYAKPGPQTYNTRTAWALVELGVLTGDRTFRKAGVRNARAALTRQLPNGWFEGNDLEDDAIPLTHTIAYAMRGALEIGAVEEDEELVGAAERIADALLPKQQADGRFAGRYDRQWSPVVSWSCLTGNAQLALNFLRLDEITGRARYRVAAERALSFNASAQDLRATDPGVRGGIPGAYPIYGAYGRFELLNWAAKFFADALMLLGKWD